MEYTWQQLMDYAERYYYENGKAYSDRAKELFAMFIEGLDKEKKYKFYDFKANAVVEEIMGYSDLKLVDDEDGWNYLRYDYLPTPNSEYSILEDAKGDELSYALTLIKEELEEIIWSLKNAMRSIDAGLFEPFEYKVYIKQKIETWKSRNATSDN